MVLVSGLLVSCSSGGPQRYASTSELVPALNEAGIECSSPQGGPAADLVKESVSCASEDGELSIFIFASTKARDDWRSLGTRLLPTALGPNWAVSGTQAQAEEISEEMDAELVLPARP